MVAVLVFSLVLLLAVLVSKLADRSVLSTAVLFLAAGFLAGGGVLNLLPLNHNDVLIERLSELALFSVLFTDGMKVGWRDLTSAWRLPGRALLLGLPLTLLGSAALAHFTIGLNWIESLLLGAVLAPTDPVFASALIARKEVPYRLRHLLNVESGLNDGLALPIVLVLLAVIAKTPSPGTTVALELLMGVIFGVAIPLAALKLEQSRLFAATKTHKPLMGFAIGMVLYAVTSITHANAFLAAFAAGITVASVDPSMRQAFHEFGELIAELLKLAALLVFGALISPAILRNLPISGYVFAVLTLIAVRPLAMWLAIPPRRQEAAGNFTRREWIAAAWFGPKGFASVVYGLLVLHSGITRSEKLFHIIAVCIVVSILAHSSTDVIVSRWFIKSDDSDGDEGQSTLPEEAAA